MRIIMKTLCPRRRIPLIFLVVVSISAIKLLLIPNTSGSFFQSIGLKNFKAYSPSPSAFPSRDDPKPAIPVPKPNLKTNATKAAKANDVDQDLKWNEYMRKRGLLQDDNSVLFRVDLPFDKNAYDILSMNPIKFDPVYKNPCWLGSETNGPIADGKLHCLPYFYLIGVKKSATSDLYSRIAAHPDFVSAGFKESQWIPRLRWGIFAFADRRYNTGNYMSCQDLRSVDCFISMFDKAAQKISYGEHAQRNTHLITADSTPNTMYSHTNWKLLPGNEGLLEPKYTDFHYIKHMTPNVKIVIIIRDPVTRLYSDFLHTMGVWAPGKSRSPETFHEQVTQLTQAYNECFSRWTMRRCIYNETIRHQLMRKGIIVADSFTASFYAFYMNEMINVFGKDRIHPILTKEYHDTMETTLRDLFAFLDMKKLQPLEMERISGRTEKLLFRKNKLEMLSKTRDLLYKYYKPYNHDMAILMNDNRYLFPQQPN